ncbi:hypothetical protein TWF694_009368 [Orbilia ellipsospora]|uniref:PNPLA domain-containing protein n=1 Tax=Orbilia ellipsospora TaxID=2528407 RepID=A0AAV9XEP4_9PEZI
MQLTMSSPWTRFVCATRTANTELTLLRTYKCNEEDDNNPPIWQAARATSAAPTFFPPVSMGNPPSEYVDGAMLKNNPIRVLMRESKRIWGSDVEYSCIISIGTGVLTQRKLGSKGHQILLACVTLATHAENVAREFRADEGGTLKKEGKYYRFNAPQGVREIKLDEWRDFDTIDATTRSYLNDVDDDIEACVKKLVESRWIPPRRPSSPDPIESEYVDIPRQSSRYFTGRVDMLQDLHNYFQAPSRASPRIAVFIGLGGIGKTQTALHYFEQERKNYPIALFVECNSEQEALSAFIRFGNIVVDEECRKFPENSYSETAKSIGFSCLLEQSTNQSRLENRQRIVKAVKSWLARKKERFLIIFDNYDDPHAMNLTDYIPYQGNGDIIITTRDHDTGALGQKFSIDEMPKSEAIDLLERSSGLNLRTKELLPIASKITESLGYLPLAIDQAGGYLAHSDQPISSFLPIYEKHARSILSRIPSDGMLGYRYSAFTTWEMSFERLLLLSPTSASLLELLGFVNNQDIHSGLYNPMEALRPMAIKGGSPRTDMILPTLESTFGGQESMGGAIGVRYDDGFVFNEAFQFLSKLCLARRSKEMGIYYVHPVVHVWIRERIPPLQRNLYARYAIVFVARALPTLYGKDSTDVWKTHRRLFPHIQAAWGHIKKYVPPDDDKDCWGFLDALEVLANSLQEQGLYDLAEEMQCRVYEGKTAAFGVRSEATLDSATKLATIYDRKGNATKSEELYKLALEAFTELLGEGHAKTLAVIHNLAGVLNYRAKYLEAEIFYRKALEGRKKLGVGNLDTLETMDALASLLYASQRAKEAEPLRRYVLEKRRELLGPGDSKTLTTALNMGILLSGLGKNDEALKTFDQTYQEGQKVLHESQSPSAFSALTTIAVFYANIGHAKKAEALFRDVLAGQKLILGDFHPDTLWTQNCLGGVLFVKEKNATTAYIVEKAFIDIEGVLGPKHLDTLWVGHNLALVYQAMGRSDEAEALQERVVEGYMDELGDNHVNTLYMINDLGDIYAKSGKYEKAEARLRKAFEGKKKNFGFRSPHTLYSATMLAGVLKELGKLDESEELFKETLNTTIEILGNEHADVCLCMMSLAELYFIQERFPECLQMYKKVYAIRKQLQGEGHNNTLHTKKLLEETERRMADPSSTSDLVELFKRDGAVLSQFGYRCRDDVVQVLF